MSPHPLDWWETASISCVSKRIPARLRRGPGQDGLARALAADLSDLTLAFNHERSSLPADYLQDPHRLSAYIAQFGILNAHRVFRALGELPKPRLAALQAKGGELRLLDLGCGTGAASAGALAALAPQSGAHLVLVDRSKSGLEAAAELLAQAPNVPQLTRVRHDLSRGWPKGPAFEARFDLIMLTNVVVELAGSVAALAKWVSELSTHLTPDGAFLIVEPATRQASRQVIELRSAVPELSTLAPCPHQAPCPLHATHPRDWCHVALPFARSNWLEKLDRRTGLDHSQLVFSYWLASPLPAEDAPYSRLVSDDIQRSGETVRLTCTPEARIKIQPTLNLGPQPRGARLTNSAP